MQRPCVPAADASDVSKTLYLQALGSARRIGGDLEGAAEAYRQAIELTGKGGGVLRSDYSKLLEKQGKRDEALFYARKAVEASPDHIVWLERLRALLYETSDHGMKQKSSRNRSRNSRSYFHGQQLPHPTQNEMECPSPDPPDRS